MAPDAVPGDRGEPLSLVRADTGMQPTEQRTRRAVEAFAPGTRKSENPVRASESVRTRRSERTG
ncbi:MAG: hypothetical protein AVDCRST_MAG80-412 [uncultured Rubrobacteraceae bacterium]|uniref:Uncharacterized protein n=1 Tax=uncultured Rubrobacteraceae bacterium TaxID=349277 RepID=A0A6J4PXN8_9ACTN|nr:MAG: hypothetical protein AVDCRST_MAG80-412 [uncultured Rubrobacteraceae bacterium]